MSKTIDTMTGFELDAFGSAHDMHRLFTNDKVEPDSYYRERIKVEMTKRSALQLPPISLRDYFAARAMQGFMSRTLIAGFDDEMICQRSYEIADQMITARDEVIE